jgi:hypothetical protein
MPVIPIIVAGGGAAPVLEQTAYGEAFPENTCNVSFDNNVAAGSLMVMTFRTDNNGLALSTVTSTPGSPTWTRATSQVSETNFVLDVWYCPNAPSGATTVTATIGGPADQMRMAIAEYSGVATSSPIDGTPISAEDFGSTSDAGNYTTSVNNAVIHVAIACDGNDQADTWTAGTNYTKHDLGTTPTGSDKTMVEYRVVSPGTYATPGNIIGGADSWASIAVAFKPS